MEDRDGSASLRREAAAHLTSLLEQHACLSYLRLGDGETQWLLTVQRGQAAPWYQYVDEQQASLGRAVGTRGLELRHYDRFVHAHECCTYLDYCENVSEANRRNLRQIVLHRDPSLLRNACLETGNIIFDWTYYELKRYFARHRCLFASAEAAIARELYHDSRYRLLASDYFPDSAAVVFSQVRDDGRNYSENLNLIKEDLRQAIERGRIDTLFLSLASGAKILCYELAEEMGIRAIDWGAISRGLAYCGSPGYHADRSDHTPFFVRVPFDVYMEALERVHPRMTPGTRIAKAHAQLMLDLQEKRLMRTTPADMNGGGYDRSPENVRVFQQALRLYRRRYRPLAKSDPTAARLHREFRRWCLNAAVDWPGKTFRALVGIKGALRKAFAPHVICL